MAVTLSDVACLCSGSGSIDVSELQCFCTVNADPCGSTYSVQAEVQDLQRGDRMSKL